MYTHLQAKQTKKKLQIKNDIYISVLFKIQFRVYANETNQNQNMNKKKFLDAAV